MLEVDTNTSNDVTDSSTPHSLDKLTSSIIPPNPSIPPIYHSNIDILSLAKLNSLVHGLLFNTSGGRQSRRACWSRSRCTDTSSASLLSSLTTVTFQGPFASLILADYGASVLRIDRAHPSAHTPTPPSPTPDLLTRHKSSIALDLRSIDAVTLIKDLLKHVDVLIDPFRPGVIEAIGLAPTETLASNPRLIIARLSGFRKDGEYATIAGHDINYLAVSGVLSQLGPNNGPPHPPANILADFAGGGLMCAFGILMALLQRTQSGKGQVVENNMVDGAAYLASMMRYGIRTPLWDKPRGENLLDGGSPFYSVYECKGGGHMAVGAIEPKFFHELLRGLDFGEDFMRLQSDRKAWPGMKSKFQQRFLQKTRPEWEEIFKGTDACCTPVVEQAELVAKGYDQRLPIHLLASPGHAIPQQEAWESQGLAPGTGGEELLEKWTGWRRGQYYNIKQGGLVKIHAPKL